MRPLHLLLLGLIACSPSGTGDEPPSSTPADVPPAASAATIEGTDWWLASLGGAAAHAAPDSTVPMLRLDAPDARATGNGGCNRFSGSYTLEGNALSFGPLAMTRRACLEEALNRQETAFGQALSDTRSWRMAGDTLVLIGDAGDLARLVRR